MSRGNHSSSNPITRILSLALAACLLCVFVYLVVLNKTAVPAAPVQTPDTSLSTTPEPVDPTPDVVETPEITEPVVTVPVVTEPPYVFEPYCTEETDPTNFIKTVGIQVNNEELGDDEVYEPIDLISFGDGKDYTDVEGIITFRGDNYRHNASYGTIDPTNYDLSSVWSKATASLTYNGATWTGSGWTGQPLIVKWPKEMKQIMNMHDWAKEDDSVVEVIYATMDGNIYFLDLNTGKETRDKLNMGFTFKGSGALDPRGYPILYLGAGYDSAKGVSRAFVISLIDFSIMYSFGNMDNFSLRGELCYFDSSALVDAETDQLIYPGENGILYIIKLNTEFDPEAGTVSIDPDNIVKWHYYGKRTSLQSYWVGMEASAAILDGYIFMTDNGGNLMCLDLNTLELVWVQDMLDDTNVTPALSFEDGHPYLYVSTSYHMGWRSWYTADVPIWKIDAENGEIVWQIEYECYSESGVSGGVQSSPALGEKGLEGLVYFTIARTPTASDGLLLCLDTDNGEVVWKKRTYYTWSSPVLVYEDDGTGHVVFCTYGGTMYFLDGLTGEVHDTFDMGGGAEASPAVYEDMIVIGTRKQKIWGVKIS